MIRIAFNTLAVLVISQIVSSTLVITSTGTGLTIGLATLTASNVATLGTAGSAVAGVLLGAKALNAILQPKRHKREAAVCLPFKNPELYFSMAKNSNVKDCGRRFVCELEATEDKDLSNDEILVKKVFR